MTLRATIAALAALTLMTTVGCSDKQTLPADEVPGSAVEWWNNPGDISDHLATVGVAPLVNPRAEGPARRAAEQNGRATMAETLKTRITSLGENWAKSVGDLNVEASLQSYYNDETLSQQYSNVEIAGAQPYKYRITATNVYCLVVLKDPTQWTENVIEAISENAAKDEAYFKTEAMKNQFRERIEKLKEEEKAKVAAAQAKLMATVEK